MRFCMVTTFYPPYHFGGDGIFVEALARALAAAGHDVEVVHCEDAYRLRGPASPPPAAGTPGITVHRLHSPLGWLSPLITHQIGGPGLKGPSLRRILDRGFDVVNFHNISLIGGPAVLDLSPAPVTLYTLHEHWLLCPMHDFWKNRQQPCDRPECLQCCLRSGVPPQLWRYTGLVARSISRVHALLAPSEYTAGRHRSLGLPVPIHVVPSFTDLDGPPADDERPERPYFLYCGRVTAAKGIVPLLDEFARLPEYDLIVAGDGATRPDLQRRYDRYPNVRFLGMVPRGALAPLYRRATALVLPSLAPEVFPLSTLEAFACGTPAIVRDAGGSREAVDQTGGGIVYTSAAELRLALHTLAGEAALRKELGRRARAGYDQHYSPGKYLERYLDLVRNARARNTSAAS